MPTVQPPSLGRVVHFVLPDSSPRRGEKRAAVVTGVSGLNANLTVFYDQTNDVAPSIQDVAGTGFIGRAWSVPFDPTGTLGTWQWPVSVPPITIGDTFSATTAEVKEVAPPAPITPASPEPTAVEGVTAQPTEDVAPAAVETPAVPAPAETTPTVAVEVAPSPVVEDVAAPAADEPIGLPLQSGDGVSTAETTPA